MVFGKGMTPANFLDRIAGNSAAQRFADQLAAKAVSDNRCVVFNRFADEAAYRLDPGQGIVDAHGAAHETEAGVIRG